PDRQVDGGTGLVALRGRLSNRERGRAQRGQVSDAFDAGYLADARVLPAGPAGGHRRAVASRVVTSHPQRIGGERRAVTRAVIPPVSDRVDDRVLAGEPVGLGGERANPPDHLPARQAVALVSRVRVVFEVR